MKYSIVGSVLGLVLGLSLVYFYLYSYGGRCRDRVSDKDARNTECLIMYVVTLLQESAKPEPHIPYLDSFDGFSRDSFSQPEAILALNNTKIEDWQKQSDDTILSIMVRTTPYLKDYRRCWVDFYIATGSSIWKVEAEPALQQYIWSLVNQHQGALEKCSANELIDELAKRSQDGFSKIYDF